MCGRQIGFNQIPIKECNHVVIYLIYITVCLLIPIRITVILRFYIDLMNWNSITNIKKYYVKNKYLLKDFICCDTATLITNNYYIVRTIVRLDANLSYPIYPNTFNPIIILIHTIFVHFNTDYDYYQRKCLMFTTKNVFYCIRY